MQAGRCALGAPPKSKKVTACGFLALTPETPPQVAVRNLGNATCAQIPIPKARTTPPRGSRISKDLTAQKEADESLQVSA